MVHNENNRVKISALIRLTSLGYEYISLKQENDFDHETNVLKSIFQKRFLEINREATENNFEKEFQNIILELGQDDLGKSFYNRLIGMGNSAYKLMDWGNFQKTIVQPTANI